MEKNHRIGLASKSPRRLQLLAGAGLEVTVVPSRAEPILSTHGSGEDQALTSALAKLPLRTAEFPTLSADTVVHMADECFGKPAHTDQAIRMLKQLSGCAHHVTTAVAIRHAQGVTSFSVTSTVYFRQLSEGEIIHYVASGEPMDKAGGYGIQGLGAGLIERVEGSHTAVVGLPLSETLRTLHNLGVHRQ